MDSPSLIADMANQGGRPALVRFQDIDLCDVKSIDNCPGIRGFSSVPVDPISSKLGKDDDSFLDDKHRKALSKGKKAAFRVAQLLNGNPQASLQRKETARGADVDVPFLCAGKRAFGGCPPCKNQSTDDEGVIWFQKMKFHFDDHLKHPSHGAITSSQYLHFSCPTLHANQELFTRLGTPIFDRVDIVSGICLFSAELLRKSIPEDGPIEEQNPRFMRWNTLLDPHP